MLGAGFFHAELRNVRESSLLDFEHLLHKSNEHYARRPASRGDQKVNRNKVLSMDTGTICCFKSILLVENVC